MTKLSQIDLTNGEAGTLATITDFLGWMKIQSAPVPADETELETLLTRYVIHSRNADMQRLCDEGKITPGAVSKMRRKYLPMTEFVVHEFDEEDEEE